MVINFYTQLQTNYKELNDKIQATCHSRALHQDAQVMYTNPHLFTEVDLAWAFWVLSHQSINASMNKTWACSNDNGRSAIGVKNKKAAFLQEMQERLDGVQIECRDALNVIKVRNLETTFFYLDPPYFNSDMGHYSGYTEHDFENLLSLLSQVKGKFILSSYPSELLAKYTDEYKWHSKFFDMPLCVSKKGKRKVEVLTANYPI